MLLPSSTATNLDKPNLRHFLKTQDFTRDELQEIFDLMKLQMRAEIAGRKLHMITAVVGPDAHLVGRQGWIGIVH